VDFLSVFWDFLLDVTAEALRVLVKICKCGVSHGSAVVCPIIEFCFSSRWNEVRAWRLESFIYVLT